MTVEQQQKLDKPITIYLTPELCERLDKKRRPLLKARATYIRDLLIEHLSQ